MSFYELIAAALDEEGIESRIHDGCLFVPISSDVELRFVEIDSAVPAANVYVAAADLEEDEDDDAALVSAVFSVEDAVKTVSYHVATDQVISLIRDLLEGADDRIADLEFVPDVLNPLVVHADVADNSGLTVEVLSLPESGIPLDGPILPRARVSFTTYPEYSAELVEECLSEEIDRNGYTKLNPEQHDMLREDVESDLDLGLPGEVMDLGTYDDFDKLFDVLAVAAAQAYDWESQLGPLDGDGYWD